MQAPTHRLAERSTCETPPIPGLHYTTGGMREPIGRGRMVPLQDLTQQPQPRDSDGHVRLGGLRGTVGTGVASIVPNKSASNGSLFHGERVAAGRVRGRAAAGENGRTGNATSTRCPTTPPPRRSCSRFDARITPDRGHKISPGFPATGNGADPPGEIRQPPCLSPFVGTCRRDTQSDFRLTARTVPSRGTARPSRGGRSRWSSPPIPVGRPP